MRSLFNAVLSVKKNTRLLALLALGQVVPFYLALAAPLSPEQLTARQKEIVALVESLAEPLTEEKHFYHYGSEAACNALIAQGDYSGSIRKKYGSLSASLQSAWGHGIYMADNLVSSARWFKGSMVEIVAQKGTQFIDLSSPIIHETLWNRLTAKEIDEVANLPLSVNVKYQSALGWYVLKDGQGIKIKEFNPAHLPVKEFKEALMALKNPRAFLFQRAKAAPEHYRAALSLLDNSSLMTFLDQENDLSARLLAVELAFPHLTDRSLDLTLARMKGSEKEWLLNRLLQETPPRRKMLEHFLKVETPRPDINTGLYPGDYKTLAESKRAYELPHSKELHLKLLTELIDSLPYNSATPKGLRRAASFVAAQQELFPNLAQQLLNDRNLSADQKVNRAIWLSFYKNSSASTLKAAVRNLSKEESALLALRLDQLLKGAPDFPEDLQSYEQAQKFKVFLEALPAETLKLSEFAQTYQARMTQAAERHEDRLLPKVRLENCKNALQKVIAGLIGKPS